MRACSTIPATVTWVGRSQPQPPTWWRKRSTSCGRVMWCRAAAGSAANWWGWGRTPHLRQVEDRRIAQRRHRNRGAVPDKIMWYDIQMIKVLEQAIEKIKSLSVERQEYAASV